MGVAEGCGFNTLNGSPLLAISAEIEGALAPLVSVHTTAYTYNVAGTPSSQSPALPQSIFYQIDRALYLLIREPDLKRVAVEFGDDVYLDDRGDDSAPDHEIADKGIRWIIVGQMKFTTTGTNPFQDRSLALWKTLANWINLRKDFGRYKDAHFLAITNTRVGRKSVVALISAAADSRLAEEQNTITRRRKQSTAPGWARAASACVKKLRAIMEKPTKDEKSSLQACFDKLKKVPDEDLVELVSRIHLLDEEFEVESSDLEKVYSRLMISSDFSQSEVLQRLRDWFLQALAERWRKKEPAIVTREQLQKALEDIKRSAERKPGRYRPLEKEALPPIDVVSYLDYVFIKKLRETSITRKFSLLNAVESYLQVQIEQLRLLTEDGCTQQEFTAMAEQLHGRWSTFYNSELTSLRLEPTEDDVVQVGQSVFRMSVSDSHPLTFRGASIEHSYVREGELHRLADRRYPGLDVWWKPRPEDLT